jgi:hypothetical protein
MAMAEGGRMDSVAASEHAGLSYDAVEFRIVGRVVVDDGLLFVAKQCVIRYISTVEPENFYPRADWPFTESRQINH